MSNQEYEAIVSSYERQLADRDKLVDEAQADVMELIHWLKKEIDEDGLINGRTLAFHEVLEHLGAEL